MADEGERAALSQLDWTLVAAFTHSDPTRASAIIKVSDGSTRYLRTGARVEGSTTLYRVEDSSVILRNDNHFERLFFEKARHQNSKTSLADAATNQSSDLTQNREPTRSLANQEIRDDMVARLERHRQSQTEWLRRRIE